MQLLWQILREPITRLRRDHLQSTRLFEEMRRARNDLYANQGTHLSTGSLIELNDLFVTLADEKQRRSFDERKGIACEVRAPSA